tara:strand:- start:2565 stop:3593 length:1029 start_codon:yes stop_codon:yes gene_type:complete
MGIQQDISEKYNILVTGIGAPGAPSIINKLKKVCSFILGVDCNIEYCASKHFVNVYKQVPKATDKLFFENILKLIKEYNITHIICLVTVELNEFAKYKSVLDELNVKIYIHPEKDITISSNKHNLYEHLKEIIQLPRYIKITLRDIEKNLYLFNYPQKEVCFKPLNLDGARGFRIISNKVNRLKQMMTEKPYNTYTSLDELKFLLNEFDDNYDVLLCEYLPGQEYTVDTFVKNGKLIHHTIRTRLKTKDHISVVGEIVKNDSISEQVFKINSMFNFNGCVGYQFKENIEGIPLLLECNPRLQGGTILSCQDFDYISANITNVKKIKNNKYTKMLRYFQESYE